MRSRALVLLPALLLVPGCGVSLRGGGGARAVGKEPLLDVHGTVGLGLADPDDATHLGMPLTLGNAAFEGGLEWTQASDDGWGYRLGPRLGAALTSPEGSFVSLRGGPTLSLAPIVKSTWIPTAQLELMAGIGASGDIQDKGIFGASLVFGLDYFGSLDFRVPSGRPLRDARGVEWQAAAFMGDEVHDRCGGAASEEASRLPAGVREVVGASWLEEARAEHASIASFVRLARELGTLGAPPSLVRRALWSAEQELGHTAMCLRIAERFLGRTVHLGPLPDALPRENLTLRALAQECWTDGCLGEGSAARVAALRARHAQVPAIRQTLWTIAREERQHAELAWDIIEWCQHPSRGVGAELRTA